MAEIPIAPIERLMRNSGVERVSESGARELRDFLEKIGRDISEKAARLARHAGRKTVKAEDIKLASSE